MIYSMTGYGKGNAETPLKRIRIEIKSVNSKQLDLSLKLPQRYKELEINMRNPIAAALGRGKIELWVNIENSAADPGVDFNEALLQKYKLKIEKISSAIGVSTPHDWIPMLLRMPEVMTQENDELNETEVQAFETALREALDNLVAFRKAEGEKLENFFIEKIEKLRNLMAKLSPFEEERISAIRVRLEENLKKIAGLEFDRCRLEQELIFYIEKLDVTEEKTRLSSHLDYFIETLKKTPENSSDGQGRKLGFIAQEIGREINTLGSKSNQADMQKIVVMMKDELEQIKEQVLNIL